MWHKFYVTVLLVLTPLASSEAVADAGAEPSPGAKADAKPGAKPSFSHGCPASMKACSNGLCLPEKWFCDGDKDCPWGEDEQNCGGQIHWQPNSQPKSQQIHWAPQSQPWTVPLPPEPRPEPIPEAEPQVWQAHPSQNLRSDPVSCPSEAFPCGAACLPLRLRCNGIQDCSDASDERGCATIPTVSPVQGATCGPDELQCFAGNCVKKTQLCDGIVHCRHYEDEFACPYIKNPEYTYKCIEACIGVPRPSCNSTKVDPVTPPPTTVRPAIRYCDQGFTLIYDRCIRVTVFPPLDWQSARAASQAYNSLLVEIDNGDFFLELQSYLNQSKYESYSYWTGASDLNAEGHWIWSGSQKKVHLGAPLWSIAREGNTYQQQPAGGREQNCGLLEDCPFQYMNDENCEKKYPYICQRPARYKYH